MGCPPNVRQFGLARAPTQRILTAQSKILKGRYTGLKLLSAKHVRFGSKADILCPIDTLPLAVRFSGKVLPMEAQMVSVDVIRTCLV